MSTLSTSTINFLSVGVAGELGEMNGKDYEMKAQSRNKSRNCMIFFNKVDKKAEY